MVRRYQKPKPKRHGKFWTIVLAEDTFDGEGKLERRQKRIRLAPIETDFKTVQLLRDEAVKPLNLDLVGQCSATTFATFVRKTYMPIELPLLAKTTQERYRGVLETYLLPRFGSFMLRDLTAVRLQEFFSTGFADSTLGWESRDKIRDVLSSVLKRAARKYGMLERNPMEQITLPPCEIGKRRSMPYLTPEQFDLLVDALPEPVATMVFTAVFSGLRISELIGLRWQDVGSDSITVERRYCRGDWSQPKSKASNATIPVDRRVIDRILRLKTLAVVVRAGTGRRKYRLVKPDGPNPELVFQSVKDGKPMRDNNLLTRFLKPAARKLGLPFVNWRCLRTSRATWVVQAGADPKAAQALMRHSHVQTTLDVYAQFVPESQRQACEATSKMAFERIANARALRAAGNGMVN